MFEKAKAGRTSPRENSGAGGFTLIETVIALIIFMIVVMGVFAAFTYSTRYNTGNSRRSQSLAVFQREVELLRSAKFTPGVVSNSTTSTPTCASADDGRRDITGGQKNVQMRCGSDGTMYRVETTVDDDPFTANVQTAANVSTPTLKEITVRVTPTAADGTWVTDRASEMRFRRVRAN